MTNIQRMLSDEIRRLAKKEVKAATEPLRVQITSLREQVRQYKKQMDNLPREAKAEISDTTDSVVPSAEEPARKIRMTSGRIKKIRGLLGLTQCQMAQLLGISHSSVVKWEIDKASPRTALKEKIVRLSKMGKRELQKRLEETMPSDKPNETV